MVGVAGPAPADAFASTRAKDDANDRWLTIGSANLNEHSLVN